MEGPANTRGDCGVPRGARSEVTKGRCRPCGGATLGPGQPLGLLGRRAGPSGRVARRKSALVTPEMERAG